MGAADFLSGVLELAVCMGGDWALEKLGCEPDDEGTLTEQLMNRQDHSCNIFQAASGDSMHSLLPGTVVYCNLAGGLAEHAGICIGRQIVHLDGSGQIICTSPNTFLARKNGSCLAVNIYYAATGKNKPLADPAIARRAKAKAGHRQRYSLWNDNCLGFTLGCITGNFNQHHNFRLGEIESARSDHFGTTDWDWRSWRF